MAELVLERIDHNITEYTAKLNYSTSIVHRWIKRFFVTGFEYIEYYREKIYKQLAKEDIDIFYSISGQTEAAITADYASRFNRPYVVGEHGAFPWVGTVLTEENRIAIEQASAFFAISNDKIRQVLMQGVELPKIYYVGNMVDDDKFIRVESGNTVKTFIVVGANVF